MIRLHQDYRGSLTNEALLEAGDYDSLSPELESYLIAKGIAESITSDEIILTKVDPQAEESPSVSPVSTIAHVEKELNKPQVKRKPKG